MARRARSGWSLAPLALALACNGKVTSNAADVGSDDGSGATGAGGRGGTGPSTTSTTTLTSATNVSSTTGGAVSVAIPFHDGYISADQNAFGIRGSFYAASDGLTSWAEPVFAASLACMQGVAGQVLTGADGMPAYAEFWGALLGVNLREDPATGLVSAYDATAFGIKGFAFTVTGDNAVPSVGELRFNVKVLGDDSVYCRRLSGPGTHVFLLSEMWQNCWENDSTAARPDPTRLEALRWQYVANTQTAYEFSLCVEDLGIVGGE